MDTGRPNDLSCPGHDSYYETRGCPVHEHGHPAAERRCSCRYVRCTPRCRACAAEKAARDGQALSR